MLFCTFFADAALSVFFGILISRFDAFRISSLGKGLIVGVIAGLVTIPLGCILFALVVGVLLTTMIPFVTMPHRARVYPPPRGGRRIILLSSGLNWNICFLPVGSSLYAIQPSARYFLNIPSA